MALRLRKGQVLKGPEAQAYLNQYPVRRNDLKYSYVDPHTGLAIEDRDQYFEVGDGRIFSACVAEEMTDNLRWAGVKEETLPWVYGVQIWANEEVLKRRNQEIWNQDPDDYGHILRHASQNKPNFPDDLPLWKQQISEYLHLEPDQLDGTMRSLALVDKAQKKLKVKQKDFFRHLYPPLVGYIGEVIRLAVDGRWHMQRARQDPDVWEPTIIAADGQPISWWSQMYDFADEQYRKYSSVGAVLIATDRVTM